MKRYQLILLSLFSALLLSLPWLGILPGWILFVAFLPLLILEDQLFHEKNKEIAFFAYAYLAFVGWNVLTTWWIMHATFFGMILVVVVNSVFMSLVWWLYHVFRKKLGTRLSGLVLVSFWLTFEFIHFHWDIAWPWLTLGNGFANQVEMVQWYEYAGVMGGSLWVLVVNLLVFKLYKRLGEHGRRRYSQSVIGFMTVVLLPVLYSFFLYRNYEEKGDCIEVVILQPSIDPYSEKFGTMPPDQQVVRLIELTDSLVGNSTDYVLAPETAVPMLWENDQMIYNAYLEPFRRLIQRCPELQVVIGANTQRLFHLEEDMPQTVRKFKDQDLYYDVYNSALQIGRDQNIEVYHKSILVSGVEKMPFSKYFSFVEDFIIDLGGATGSLGWQEEPSVFKGQRATIAPVICYESVFGDYLTQYVKKGASLIFIITNDGWWKDSPGYKQHFSFARLRAVETRRSIARSANTGISGIINQRGEVVLQTSWWVKTAITGTVHSNNELTFYTRYGDFIGRISAFVSVIFVLYLLVQLRIQKDKKIRTNPFVQNP